MRNRKCVSWHFSLRQKLFSRVGRACPSRWRPPAGPPSPPWPPAARSVAAPEIYVVANQNFQIKLRVLNDLHTFSCSIFKCLLISETSPPLEEEKNSEKLDDSEAAVDFESGLLLRDFEFISEVMWLWLVTLPSGPNGFYTAPYPAILFAFTGGAK